MTTTRKFLLFSSAILFLSALIAFAYSQEFSPAEAYDDLDEFKRLADLYRIIGENYYDDFSVRDAFSGALNGMLNRLDPHSAFVDIELYARMREQYKGNYEGIGVSFVMFDDKITVMEVLPGGPSENAGLKMGDQIVEIEGESAVGIDSDEVQRRLRGPRNTKVSVKIQRPQRADLIPFTITRGRIPLRSIENVLMLDGNTGYIRIIRFAHPTAEELDRAIELLESKGMERLILDLRGNTGGLLRAAIEVSGRFLSGPRLIVHTKGQADDDQQSHFSRARGKYWESPLIVLIDRVSASASEIVAGALQDWDRALIAGQTSFGKGLVQTGYILQDRSQLLLTTARYYTPTGRLIQRAYKGVDLESYQMQGYEYDPDEVEIEVPEDGSPVYFTAGGRKVYGGGGIKPDATAGGEPLFDRLIYYLSNNLITFLYARDYYWKHQDASLDFERFRSEFAVSDEMLRELLDLAVEREFVFYPRRGEALTSEQMEKRYWELADQLRLFLKAEIAQFYFGRNAGFEIRRTARDNQLAHARTQFDRAYKLAESHQLIDPDIFANRSNSGEDDE